VQRLIKNDGPHPAETTAARYDSHDRRPTERVASAGPGFAQVNSAIGWNRMVKPAGRLSVRSRRVARTGRPSRPCRPSQAENNHGACRLVRPAKPHRSRPEGHLCFPET
jgi:hypothetical protein